MNSQTIPVLVAVIGIVLVLFTFMAIWASRYVKAGPNQVLIVSGRPRILPDGTRVGFRCVKGGGTFVFPVIEKADTLSLEAFTVDMPRSRIRTADGAALEADCAAQLKIKSDDTSIMAAAEHFLSKKGDEIKSVVRPVLEKHLRAVLGGSNLAAMQQKVDACAEQVQSAAAAELGNMGLGFVSFTIREVRAG